MTKIVLLYGNPIIDLRKLKLSLIVFKMDVVNKALDLMQENGVKVFAIVSNQGGVEAGFVLDVSSDQFKDFLENHKLTSIQ